MEVSQPAPRVRDARATRERLLLAAESLFARKGFDGTRLREVAQLAGATVPLLCHHFGSKDALYESVLDRGMARIASMGWEVLRRGATVAEQLEGFVTGLVGMASSDPSVVALLHREMADGGLRARPLAERWLRPLKAVATEVLRDAAERGEIVRGLDLDMLVLHVTGAVLYPSLAGPLVRTVWGDDPADPAFVARRTRALLDLLLPLVQPAASGR
jgi:TetR/AcrR family transcriptional regulator